MNRNDQKNYLMHFLPCITNRCTELFYQRVLGRNCEFFYTISYHVSQEIKARHRNRSCGLQRCTMASCLLQKLLMLHLLLQYYQRTYQPSADIGPVLAQTVAPKTMSYSSLTWCFSHHSCICTCSFTQTLILNKHPSLHKTFLTNSVPVLCNIIYHQQTSIRNTFT